LQVLEQERVMTGQSHHRLVEIGRLLHMNRRFGSLPFSGYRPPGAFC
jgi:hypothetical protein